MKNQALEKIQRWARHGSWPPGQTWVTASQTFAHKIGAIFFTVMIRDCWPTFSRFFSWLIPWKSIFGYHAEGKARYTYSLSQWFLFQCNWAFSSCITTKRSYLSYQEFLSRILSLSVPMCLSLPFEIWTFLPPPPSHYHCFYKERKKKKEG